MLIPVKRSPQRLEFVKSLASILFAAGVKPSLQRAEGSELISGKTLIGINKNPNYLLIKSQ